MTADVMTARTEDRPNREQLTVRRYPVAIAVHGLWLAVATISIFAPDMITGSEQEHLPIVAILAPMAGVLATAFVCLAAAWSVVSGRRL